MMMIMTMMSMRLSFLLLLLLLLLLLKFRNKIRVQSEVHSVWWIGDIFISDFYDSSMCKDYSSNSMYGSYVDSDTFLCFLT